MAGCAALSVMASVGAAQAATEYVGGGFVELSSACAEHGWNGRQQVLMRIEPQGLPGNDRNETQIALLFATGTIAYRVDLDAGSSGQGMQTTYEVEQPVYIWNGPYAPETPTMSMFTGYREGISFRAGERRPDVEIFNLSNFNEHSGCTARVVVMLAANP